MDSEDTSIHADLSDFDLCSDYSAFMTKQLPAEMIQIQIMAARQQT